MIIVGVRNWERHLGIEKEADFFVVVVKLLLDDYTHLPFLCSLEEHGNIIVWIVWTFRTHLGIMKEESIHLIGECFPIKYNNCNKFV